MLLPKTIEIQGTRVLTTRQIANAYETTMGMINNNFSRNKKRYLVGKHYIPVEGEELKKLKSSPHFEGELKGASKAYFWTEKGALLHAKSLNTDKAWEAYDYLIDFYFRAKEIAATPAPEKKPESKSTYDMVVDVPENLEIQSALAEVRKYMTGLDVVLTEYNKYRSRDSYSHYFMILNELSVKLSGKIIDLIAIEPNLINKSEKKFDINKITQELATNPTLFEIVKLASSWSKEQQGRAIKFLR